MSLLHLAVFGVLGAAAASLGWLLTRRIVAMKPQTANLITVALVAAIFGGVSPLVNSMLDDWDANRGAYQAGLQLYGNERAARAFGEAMKSFLLRDRPLIERLQKERASALQQSASQKGLANNRQALFAELAARGLSRLPGEEADAFFAAKRALADVSPEICAGLWTGRTRPEAIMAALRRLPEEKQLQGLDKLPVDERRLLVRAVTDPLIVDR